MHASSKKIAIIGSGISGLSAAWAVSQHHQVDIFEKNAKIGGHTNTISVPSSLGMIDIDTGFVVFNEPNYPNFSQLLRLLDVECNATRMHFSVSCRERDTEYASNGLGALFADLRNLTRPSFYSMLADILRFHRLVPVLAKQSKTQTIGHFLKDQGFGPAFIDDHLLPMAAAIWSCPVTKILEFPAHSLARFFMNHGLTRIRRAFEWHSVANGSASYLAALTGSFSQNIHCEHEVVWVNRKNDLVELGFSDGKKRRFDQVIFACHAPQAKKMLQHQDKEEMTILEKFKTQPNRAVLHQDEKLMPRRKRAWSSWNYLCNRENELKLAVTYWMNSLQTLPCEENFFVTLNPFIEPVQEKIIQSFDYEHPIFDEVSLEAQKQIWSIQGRGGIWYAGAWMGYGFHEDGVQAGLAIAESICKWRRPWQFDFQQERLYRPSPIKKFDIESSQRKAHAA